MAPKGARPSSRRNFEKAGQEGIKADKYNHVHCFVGTGRWGAWVRELKRGGKRLYIGTHLTDRLAARCQDRALLKLETNSSTSQPIKLNFDRRDYEEDERLRNTLSSADFFKLLRGESRSSYKRNKKTDCLRKFMAQERALGNLKQDEALGNLAISSEGFALQNSVNNKECLSTESIGESNNLPDYHDETSEEGDHDEETYEDNLHELYSSPYEGPAHVVSQNSESANTDSGAPQGKDMLFASVASAMTCATILSWNGKRRRTSASLASAEKKAIEAILLLSLETNCKTT